MPSVTEKMEADVKVYVQRQLDQETEEKLKELAQ